MRIKVEKKLVNDEIFKTEELILTIPKAIYDELDWEDGTFVEWDISKKMRMLTIIRLGFCLETLMIRF